MNRNLERDFRAWHQLYEKWKPPNEPPFPNFEPPNNQDALSQQYAQLKVWINSKFVFKPQEERIVYGIRCIYNTMADGAKRCVVLDRDSNASKSIRDRGMWQRDQALYAIPAIVLMQLLASNKKSKSGRKTLTLRS